MIIDMILDRKGFEEDGVMDYYKIQNLNADTSMRKAIAGESNKDNDQNNNGEF